MPIGAFKLTTISRAASAAAESYFILYSTSISSSDLYDLNIDADGRFLINVGMNRIAKITNTGTITWQKEPSIQPVFVALKNNGEATFFSTGASTGRFAFWEIANSNGAENYKTDRTHSTFNGIEINNGSATIDSAHSAFFGFKQRDASQNYMNLIIKVDDSGSFSFTRWGRTSGSYDNAGAGPAHLARDNSNNIYARIVDTNYYLAKFNNSLTHQWTKQLSWSANPTVNRFARVAVGSDGSVYGGGTASQAKIWKLDSSQARAWEYQLSVVINLQPDCIEIDSANNIYVYGRDGQTGYIFKIDSSGTLQWTRTLTTNGRLDGLRVRIINDIMYVIGNGYVSGEDMGGFIMKLPTDGTKTGTYGNFVYSTYSGSLTSINEMTVTAITPTINSGIGNYNTTNTPSITYSSPGFSTLTKTTV